MPPAPHITPSPAASGASLKRTSSPKLAPGPQGNPPSRQVALAASAASAASAAVPKQDGFFRAPSAQPPFTKADLLAAIPAHCFKKSLLLSFGYLSVDLLLAAALYYASTFIWLLPSPAQALCWPLYWVCQGCICTGLWVIAHECGHRAFADSKLVCDAVGLVLHSALLVPYHSWRISHGKHHRSTGDVDRDEAFAPLVLADHDAAEAIKNPPGPLRLVVEMVAMLLVGWPTYLLTHITGRKYERRTNHFEPSSPLFSASEYWLVVLSDAALVLVLAGLGWLTVAHSFSWLFAVYAAPLLIVNFWLVLITYLQHTDRALPHYRGREWNWLRGALCTVDRDYGVLNAVFHHIGDTHVAHHLFSNMPHYHAQEATEALKPILNEYYYQDSKPIARALWDSFTYCRFVDAVGDVLWFRH